MSEMAKTVIRGIGMYVPEKVLTNTELVRMVDTTEEWILTRTGIEERRIIVNGQTTSDLAVEASREAIKNAGLDVKDIDLIILATISPDMIFPATACLVQNKLGAKCPAFDISAACSGFPYAITVADGMIKGGLYKNVLVIGAEALSCFLDWTDRSTCVLFGDGAGAAVLSCHNGNHGILYSLLGSDGSCADLLKMPAGGSAMPATHETVKNRLHSLKMEGAEIFKIAIKTMEEAVIKVVKKAGLKIEDIDCLIPHQANIRIINGVSERLNFPYEKVFINLQRYGNMSAASTPVALYEAVKSGIIKPGSIVVLVAFGSGLTWAATVIRW